MNIWVFLGLLLNLGIVIGAWMIDVRPHTRRETPAKARDQRCGRSSSDDASD